jgi:all-trans-retinol 13,14-reductase
MGIKSIVNRNSAVVIGAGVSGLVCAARMAKAGFDVMLMEQNSRVGGLSQGWERKIRLKNNETVRATFDLTHVVAEFLPGEQFHHLYSELGVDWANVGPFIPVEKVACLMTRNGAYYEILGGFNESLTQFKKLYPEESHNIDRYFRGLDGIDEQFTRAANRSSGWRRSLELFLEPLIEKITPLYGLMCLFTKPDLVKWRSHTHKELIDTFFDNPRLKIHLSMVADYMGLPASRASGLMMSLVLLSFWKHGGPVVPKRCSYQALHEELARVLVEKHGGHVQLRTRVTNLAIKGGRITGVDFRQRRNAGDVASMDAQTVVIAADMKKVLLPLSDRLPSRYVRKLQKMKMATSFMSVLAVVDRTKLQLEARHGHFASNMIVSSVDALELEKSEGFPEQYNIIVSFPSLVRPDAPHVASLDGQPLEKYLRVDLTMKCPPHEMWVSLRNEDKKAYRARKEETAQQMLAIVAEQFLPGLEDAVEYKVVFTSTTMERYCSVTEGSVYGFEQTPQQFPPHRMPPWTPIRGLYATGSGTLAGGIAGVIVAAEKTADIVIRERLKK